MDSRTVKAVLKELAASPREISEACFDAKTGKLTRIVYASRQGSQLGPVPSTLPGSIPGVGSRDATPRIKVEPRKTAVASLKLAAPEWIPDMTPGSSDG